MMTRSIKSSLSSFHSTSRFSWFLGSRLQLVCTARFPYLKRNMVSDKWCTWAVSHRYSTSEAVSLAISPYSQWLRQSSLLLCASSMRLWFPVRLATSSSPTSSLVLVSSTARTFSPTYSTTLILLANIWLWFSLLACLWAQLPFLWSSLPSLALTLQWVTQSQPGTSLILFYVLCCSFSHSVVLISPT